MNARMFTSGAARDLKIWLLPEVALDDNQTVGNYTVRELREIMRFVRRNADICFDHWVHLHGRPKKRG